VTRVKICGLTRREDVELAIELGANAVGFVLEPSSPRCVGLAEIADLLDGVPPYVARTAVMGPFQPGKHLASFDAVQAIGSRRSMLEASQRAIAVLRLGAGDELPPWEDIDALLIDAHVAGEYGGTGHAVSLPAAKAAMADSVRPVIVAGGLTADSVGTAIKELRPFAVDVSSGVESGPGTKDRGAMTAFFAAVLEADRSLVP